MADWIYDITKGWTYVADDGKIVLIPEPATDAIPVDPTPDMVHHISIGVNGRQAERYIRMSGPDRDEFDSNVGKYIDQVWGDKYDGAVSDGSAD